MQEQEFKMGLRFGPAIRGDKFAEYVKNEIERMGFKDEAEMVLVDQLWRERFGTPLPNDYYHQRDFHLLETDMPQLSKGGLTLVI